MGAYADFLLVDDHPLKEVLTDPGENLDLIVKGGEIFKDSLEPR
ncbi:hypothetical protein [Microbulbifer elongatus]|nr:hypothetical protein [Microbulbifer elongatus]